MNGGALFFTRLAGGRKAGLRDFFLNGKKTIAAMSIPSLPAYMVGKT